MTITERIHHAAYGRIGEVAEAIGKPEGTLHRELNPYDDRAKLGVDQLLPVLAALGSFVPLDEALRRYGLRLAQLDSPQAQPLERLPYLLLELHQRMSTLIDCMRSRRGSDVIATHAAALQSSLDISLATYEAHVAQVQAESEALFRADNGGEQRPVGIVGRMMSWARRVRG